MKKPDVSRKANNSNLAGKSAASSWVQGRNCVYLSPDTEKYRVSIQSSDGWKTYGHFHDLEVASYVANVAILFEGCEEKYQLNDVGEKDRNELNNWRALGDNASIEQVAKEKFSLLKVNLERMRLNELDRLNQRSVDLQKASEEREARSKKAQEIQASLITNAPTAELIKLLERNLSGDLYRQVRSELERRKNANSIRTN